MFGIIYLLDLTFNYTKSNSQRTPLNSCSTPIKNFSDQEKFCNATSRIGGSLAYNSN